VLVLNQQVTGVLAADSLVDLLLEPKSKVKGAYSWKSWSLLVSVLSFVLNCEELASSIAADLERGLKLDSTDSVKLLSQGTRNKKRSTYTLQKGSSSTSTLKRLFLCLTWTHQTLISQAL